MIFVCFSPAYVAEKLEMRKAAKMLNTEVKAATNPEVEGSEEGGKEQKVAEGETTGTEKKKKKRIGFHDRKVN